MVRTCGGPNPWVVSQNREADITGIETQASVLPKMPLCRGNREQLMTAPRGNWRKCGCRQLPVKDVWILPDPGPLQTLEEIEQVKARPMMEDRSCETFMRENKILLTTEIKARR